MFTFYDERIPGIMEKLLKPYGGTVRQGIIRTGDEATPGGGLTQVWIANLPQEARTRIAREGFPLFTVGGALAAQSLPEDQVSPEMKATLNLMALAGLAPPMLRRGRPRIP